MLCDGSCFVVVCYAVWDDHGSRVRFGGDTAKRCTSLEVAVSDPPVDPYWRHVRLSIRQLEGMRDGFNDAAGRAGRNKLTLLDFFVMNAHAELPELLQAFSATSAARRRARSFLAVDEERRSTIASVGLVDAGVGAALSPPAPPPAEVAALQSEDRRWERKLTKTGHCSAVVRVTPDNRDLLLAHNTWDDYSKMLRVFKYYDFSSLAADPDTATRSGTAAFSSYPGCISSTDEFYELSSGLAVASTSLEVGGVVAERPRVRGMRLFSNFTDLESNMKSSLSRWIRTRVLGQGAMLLDH